MIKKFSVFLFLGFLSFSHVFGLQAIEEEEETPLFNANLHVPLLQSLLEREKPDLDEIQCHCLEKNKQFFQTNPLVSKVYFELVGKFSTLSTSKKKHYSPLLEKLRSFHNWPAEERKEASQAVNLTGASFLDTSRDSLDSQGLTSLEKKEGLDDLINGLEVGLIQSQFQGQQVDIDLFFSNTVTPKVNFIRSLKRGYNIHCLDKIFKERDSVVLRADALGLVDSTLTIQSIIVNMQDYFQSMTSLQVFKISMPSGEIEIILLKRFLEEVVSFFKDFEEDSISQKLASGAWGLALEIDKKINQENKRKQTKGATEVSLAVLRSYLTGRDLGSAETYLERESRLFVAYLETLQYKYENMNFGD